MEISVKSVEERRLERVARVEILMNAVIALHSHELNRVLTSQHPFLKKTHLT